MRIAFVLVLLGPLLLAACGPDARRVRAESALETSRRVLTGLEADSAGGEAHAETSAALEQAIARLEETEHAYDLWRGSTGSMAFERTAACLSNALADLRLALTAQHRSVSEEFETAEQEMASFTERPCRRR